MRALSFLALPLLAACVAPLPDRLASKLAVAGPSCEQTVFDPALILGRRPEAVGYAPMPFPVRIVGPGIAATKDYRAARLNLVVDDTGRIISFHCG